MKKSKRKQEIQIEIVDESYKSFILAMVFLLVLTTAGTIGYELLEGWGFQESFYMTVITLSTVGFGEVKPLSPEGKTFTIVLIMAGMCVVAYTFSVIGRVMFEGEYKRFRRLKKMMREIGSFDQHIILCGYGRLTKFIIPQLEERRQDYVVVEIDQQRIDDLAASNIPHIEGSAYEDETLIRAGVKRAKALLAFMPKDSDNVYATLCARSLSKDLTIVSRMESAEGGSKLRLAGADTVVSPLRVASSRVVEQIIHNNVEDFHEIIRDEEGVKLVVEQVTIPGTSSLAGQSLKDAALRNKVGVTVAACITDGKMNLRPTPDTQIEPESTLVVLGTSDAIEELNALL